jgi:hypothetical protein
MNVRTRPWTIRHSRLQLLAAVAAAAITACLMLGIDALAAHSQARLHDVAAVGATIRT